MPKTRISPTAIAKASRCLHSWYLKCYGDPSEKREPDAGLLLLFERGIEHERECVSSLKDVVEPEWDGKDYDAGLQSTTTLMKEASPCIFLGVLVTESAVGFPTC